MGFGALRFWELWVMEFRVLGLVVLIIWVLRLRGLRVSGGTETDI